jgi:hypothetical protein
VKQTITINTPQDLKQFQHEFVELIDVVRQANGKYVLYVKRDASPATRSAFITKAQFDAALSPAMRTGSPAAFSPHIANGKFTQNRLTLAYAAYQRAQAQAEINANTPALIRNRDQYLAIYGEQFGFYPPGKIGVALNRTTTAALR